VVFALALWGLSRQLPGWLKQAGVVFDYPTAPNEMMARVITFVGAGIYEEVLFRLLLFGGAVWLLRRSGLLSGTTFALAALASAVAFSAAHHAPGSGEPYNGYVFLFRTMAGFYFTLLFQLRGFGIAVGAHACYDVLAGVVMA
jgi:membrane protease YdiL (CAAX protease family)